MERSERDLLENFITAATKSIDDPMPHNEAAADALWDQLVERWKQLPPVDRDEMNRVAVWLDSLEAGEINAPDELIQTAAIVAKRYLNDPTEEHTSELDIVWNEVKTQTTTDAQQTPQNDALKVIVREVYDVMKDYIHIGVEEIKDTPPRMKRFHEKLLFTKRHTEDVIEPLMKQLTERQQKVFTLMTDGQSSMLIARTLQIDITQVVFDLEVIAEKYEQFDEITDILEFA